MNGGNKAPPLTYREAGVDIEAADAFVERIAKTSRRTHGPEVLPFMSAFAGLFRLPLGNIADPVLAAACDGVGTKLLIAREYGRYRGLGQDLVAMQVNDLLPSGARPLFFLDYIATGKLDPSAMAEVVEGAADACHLAGCALLGGETAEMPDVYAPGDFDLCGFAVGLADGAKLPQPETIAVGDSVLALASSGVHSNGLTLARKALLERGRYELDDQPESLGQPLGEVLLEPTRIYVREVLSLFAEHPVKASAHVTGGGLLGRGSRLVAGRGRLRLEPNAFETPAIFELIAEAGSVTSLEMGRTFNMGLGYLVVVDPSTAAEVLSASDTPWLRVGEVVAGSTGVAWGDLHHNG